MDKNPFLNQKFIKDIKRSFIPSELFVNDMYNYDKVDVSFKLNKNNIIEITVKQKLAKTTGIPIFQLIKT